MYSLRLHSNVNNQQRNVSVTTATSVRCLGIDAPSVYHNMLEWSAFHKMRDSDGRLGVNIVTFLVATEAGWIGNWI
jgi:hypothetical protein